MKTKEQKVINIGLAITGSFCTHAAILEEAKSLIEKGYNVLPILSFAVRTTDTRFGRAEDFYNRLKEVTGNQPVDSLVLAEPVGPKNMIDVLVVAPCTGNTLSKLSNATTDTPVTMVAKAHMRNNKPVVIGISTNDGLGLNMKNIATLMAAKNVFFIPFSQDNPIDKPKSLISDFSLTEKTVQESLEGRQLQPVIFGKI